MPYGMDHKLVLICKNFLAIAIWRETRTSPSNPSFVAFLLQIYLFLYKT